MRPRRFQCRSTVVLRGPLVRPLQRKRQKKRLLRETAVLRREVVVHAMTLHGVYENITTCTRKARKTRARDDGGRCRGENEYLFILMWLLLQFGVRNGIHSKGETKIESRFKYRPLSASGNVRGMLVFTVVKYSCRTIRVGIVHVTPISPGSLGSLRHVEDSGLNRPM